MKKTRFFASCSRNANSALVGASGFKAGLLLTTFLGLSLPVAQADILPPNYKPIRHLVHFTNVYAVTNYVFYVYPRDLSRGRPGNSSVRVATNGTVNISNLNPLAISQARGIYLVAIPATLARTPVERWPEEWFTVGTNGVLKCKLPTVMIRGLPNSDPRDKIDEWYEIRGLPERLEVAPVKPKEDTVIKQGRIGVGTSVILVGIAALAAMVLIHRDRISRAGSK